MRLDGLKIFVVAPPAPGWGGRYWIVVKLTTACGIVGHGEVYAAAVGPAAMRAVIEDVFARHMAGQDPARVEWLFRRVYYSGFTGRPDPTVMGAFSGLEIACWDILGKALDRPVHALLGGAVDRRLRAYTYLYPDRGEDEARFWSDPAAQARVAAARAAEGWTALKFDPAGPYTVRGGHQPALADLALSEAFCRAIRDAVGDRADLLFGTHGQFTPEGAIRLGRRLEPFDPLWFEEPVPPDNPDAMARVARAVRIPVAAGERLTTVAEFAALLRAGGAAIVQPATGRAGGIWQTRKIAILAEAHGAQIAPHLYAGPVEWAANCHVAAACPNLLTVETIDTPFHRALIGDTLRVEGGFVTLSDAPGLGIAFDEALALAHPYAGDRLHLEMQDAPCRYDAPNRFGGGAPPEA
jgi:galactonate dehydratase